MSSSASVPDSALHGSAAPAAGVTHRYYQASGRIPLKGPVTMLLLGAAGAFLLAPLYALADRHAGVDQLRGLACSFYGMLVGAWSLFCSQAGKVRNRVFSGIVGFVIGLSAVYFAWTWFLCIFHGWDFGLLSLDPVNLWKALPDLARQGIWERNGQPVGSVEQTLWWAGEAIAIVAVATCLSSLPARPFCERCGKWTAKAAELAVPLPTAPGLKEQLEAEKYDELANLLRLPAGLNRSTGPHMSAPVTLYSCPDCDESHYLQLVATTAESQTGERKYVTLKPLLVPPEVAAWIKDPSILFRSSPTDAASPPAGQSDV